MSLRVLVGVLCAVTLSVGCEAPGKQIPLPVSNAPISVPEPLLDELRKIPFAEEPLPADTCLAVTRQEIVPVVTDGELGFSEFGWNMGVTCPYIPGQVCFAADDGRCECHPEPKKENYEFELPGLPEPLNECRLVRNTVRTPSGGFLLRNLSCDGKCLDSTKQCQRRRLKSKGDTLTLAIGCTCVNKISVHSP